MNKNKNSKTMLVLSVFIILLIMSAASAADSDKTSKNNETQNTLNTINNEDVSVDETSNPEVTVDEKTSPTENNNILGSGDTNKNNILNANNNEDKLTADDDPAGSLADLTYLIKLSDEELKLSKNYNYTTGDSGIVINKNNFVLDGDGCTIDAQNQVAAFSITGDNVVIKNLNIINSKQIVWSGHQGSLIKTNISYSNSIHWSGNDAIIDTVILDNMKGSNDCFLMWFDGINVNVQNSIFKNSGYYSTRGYRFGVIVDGNALGVNLFKNCTFDHITSGTNTNGGTLFIRAADVTVDGCYFYNCSSPSGNIFSTGTGSVINTHFEDISPTNTMYRLAFIETTADFCGQGAVMGIELIKNCTFKNQFATDLSKAHIIMADENIQIIGCTFENVPGIHAMMGILQDNNFTNLKTPVLLNDYDLTDRVTITGCNFTDNNIGYDYLVELKCGGNYIVNNNRFKNNTLNKAVVSISEGIGCNINNNTFVGNTASEGDLINKGVSFTDHSNIFVSDNPTGDGLDENHTTNLTNALNIVTQGGTIHILNGTHNITSTTSSNPLTFNFNIVGGNNVVLNTQYINLANGYKMENIICNHTSQLKYNGHCTLNNITFINSQSTEALGLLWGYAAYNSELNGIRLIDSNINLFLHPSTSNNQYFLGLTNINDLTVENSNVTTNVFDFHALLSSTIDKVTVTNSNIGKLFSMRDNYYSYDSSVSNVDVRDSIVNLLFHISNKNKNNGNVNFKHINVDNLNITTTNGLLFNVGYNQVFDDVTVNNVRMSKPFYLVNLNNYVTFKNSVFSNIINASDIIRVGTGGVLDNITIKNIQDNTPNGVNNWNSETQINDLKITGSTLKDIVILSSNSVLSNSRFNNVNGSVNVTGGDANIKNTTFIGINSVNGSLIISGENFMIENSQFTNNYASECGGAIHIKGNGTQIINTQFNDNRAGVHGGAIFVSPGVYYYKDSLSTKLTIEDPETDPVIDGLYREGYIKSFTIIYVDSQLSEDHPEDHVRTLAAAFGIIEPNGMIIGVRYNDNFTIDATSAQYAFAKNNVTIVGNHTNVKIEDHLTVGSYGSDLTIKNIIFHDSPGHAIIWMGKNGKIINCTFKDNVIDQDSSSSDSYAFALDIEAEGMEIHNTSFIANGDENIALVGGTVFFNSTGLLINNCTFERNFANTASCILLTDSSKDITIKNSQFINNTHFTNGRYGSVVVNGKNVTIEGCVFENNTFSGNGSCLVLNSPIGVINITNNRFNNNTANNGGALYIVESPSLSICGNNFTNNTANENGGAVYSSIGLDISGGEFKENHAVNGGAVYAYGLIADGVKFIGNTASNGGALYLSGNSKLDNVTFISNEASGHGSAIYFADGELELNTVNLTDNVNSGSDLCTIHVVDGASIGVNGLVMSKDSSTGVFNQGLCGDYKLDILYVSSSGSGSGWFRDAPASLTTETFNHLNDNAKVIFLNNGDVYNVDNAVVIDALKNIALVGNGSTIRNNKDKSLFNNHLTHIKSCS